MISQETSVLTNDLRWISAGDVEIGDELLGFDGESRGLDVRGHSRRRRYQRAIVVNSQPRKAECFQVFMENGNSLITSVDQLWFVRRSSGRSVFEWVPSSHLMGHAGRYKGTRITYEATYQFQPWNTEVSYAAGWLAGLMDGEASLDLGHLVLPQAEGPVLDYAEQLMIRFGYNPSRCFKPTHDGGKPMATLNVTGGFARILQALGELRPVRLINNWSDLSVSDMCIHPFKVPIIAINPVGLHDVQAIKTTEDTYFGEGYLMHGESVCILEGP